LTWIAEIRLIPPVAQIAQSVEQRIENPRVGGSIPPLGTIKKQKARPCDGLFVLCPTASSSITKYIHVFCPSGQLKLFWFAPGKPGPPLGTIF
jgi:hypothetical protein